MNSISRRSIMRTVAGGAAVVALSPVARIWAQIPPIERTIESTLTGSIIEIIDDDWEFSLGFGGQDAGEEYLRELYIMNNETSALEVEFVQSQLTPEQYLQVAQDRFAESYAGFEVADSGTTDAGLWFAASMAAMDFTRSIYAEYQPGAYEDADLMVTLMSEPDDFQANLPSAQQSILVGDLEPFMMIDPSEVMTLEFPVLAVAPATESTGRTTRSSRSTQDSADTDDETSGTRSNRRGQSQTSTSDDDFVGAVQAHREDFTGTFNEFTAALLVFAGDNPPEADLAEAFGTIDQVAEIWLTYPDRASELSAPAEYADLERVYRTWANEVGALGQEWFAFVNQVGSVEAFFDQLDVVEQANLDLEAELDSL